MRTTVFFAFMLCFSPMSVMSQVIFHEFDPTQSEPCCKHVRGIYADWDSTKDDQFLYYAFDDVFPYISLWKTDTSVANTLKFKNAANQKRVQGVKYPFRFKNKVFAQAGDGLYPDSLGAELWILNGIAATGKIFKDINPGRQSSSPQYLIRYKGKMYFQANDGTKGAELWVSDGTDTGTHLFVDIAPGAMSGNPERLYVCNGYLFFCANNGINGRELWRTDGTVQGTLMLKDINTSGNSSVQYLNMGADGWDGEYYFSPCFQNRMYFQANDGKNGNELWITDGTPTGTVMLRDINTSSTGASSYPYIASSREYNGKFYFSANDGVHGVELWVTDGTKAGTRMFMDINKGYGNSDPSWFVEYNGKLVFSANDGIHGHEVWLSDGTVQGTFMLKDIVTGSSGSDPEWFTPLRHHLYFTAAQTTSDRLLFVTDGTASGTHVVPNPYATKTKPSHILDGYSYYKNKLYFRADYKGTGYRLWAIEDTSKPQPQSAKILESHSTPFVKAYPVPASYEVNFQYQSYAGEDIFINVIDMTGITVQSFVSKNTSGVISWDISEVSVGMYFYKAYNAHGLVNGGKIIVTK